MKTKTNPSSVTPSPQPAARPPLHSLAALSTAWHNMSPAQRRAWDRASRNDFRARCRQCVIPVSLPCPLCHGTLWASTQGEYFCRKCRKLWEDLDNKPGDYTSPPPPPPPLPLSPADWKHKVAACVHSCNLTCKHCAAPLKTDGTSLCCCNSCDTAWVFIPDPPPPCRPSR